MPRTPRATPNRRLRIIGGRWRGRKLDFPDIDGLRPTGDRIRETLFNWLAADIPGARCLDLFTGAGALGLEALSRGAARVLMIDRHPAAVDQLLRHLNSLEPDPDQRRGRVLKADALAWLQSPERAAESPYDLVFIDPPFADHLWTTTLTALHQAGIIAPGGAVYLESPPGPVPGVPPDWQLHREKSAGRVHFRLYHYLPDS